MFPPLFFDADVVSDIRPVFFRLVSPDVIAISPLLPLSESWVDMSILPVFVPSPEVILKFPPSLFVLPPDPMLMSVPIFLLSPTESIN